MVLCSVGLKILWHFLLQKLLFTAPKYFLLSIMYLKKFSLKINIQKHIADCEAIVSVLSCKNICCILGFKGVKIKMV